jgi:flavin-dependent dehydrogenase
VLLVEAARSAGASVREGVTVREPLLDAGRVVGALVREDGCEREVRARITLAADGLNSRFARRLGLGLGDGGRRTLGLTARYRAAEAATEQVEMLAGGPGCCGMAVRDGEVNLGMVAGLRAVREIGGNPARYFHQALAQFPSLLACVRGEPLSVRTVGPLTWRTRRQSTAGCLLLGDAAGFYDPFTGQGVTFALLTALLAAEVVGRALAENDLSERRLSEYARRRTGLLEPRVRVQQAIQAVIERPGLLAHIMERLERRPETARTLIGVVADVLPASRVLAPGFLARLLL